jgi:hypothetical protein
MKNAKNKAKETIDKYLNLSINFPYIDVLEGQCIGIGYMTYNSAVICAKIEVNSILETRPSAIVFWNEVRFELEVLSSYPA